MTRKTTGKIPPLALVRWVAALALVGCQNALGQFNPDYNRYFPQAAAASADRLPALANQLAGEAQHLVENVRYDYAGTYQGRNLETQAGMVLNAATDFFGAVQIAGDGRAQAPAALSQFDRALAAFTNVLRTSPGVATRTGNSLDTLQKLAFQLRQACGSYGPPPGRPPFPGNPPIVIPGLPCPVQQLAQETANLQIAANQFADIVSGAYPGLSSRAAGFREQIRYFQELQATNTTFAQLRAEFQKTRLQATTLKELLQVTASNVDLMTPWSQVVQSVNSVGRLLAYPEELGMPGQPSRPPVVIVPTPVPSPGQPQPGFGLDGRFLGLLDRAIPELEAFVATVQSNVNGITEGWQFLGEGRQLQSAMTTLYQQGQQGADRALLMRTMREVSQRTRSIQSRIDRVAGNKFRNTPNNARFRRISEMIDSLNRVL